MGMDDMPPYDDLNFLTWPAGHGLGWHAHPEFQIIHILNGELDVDVGEGWYRHRAGDVHVLPPGIPHRTRTDRGHRQLGLNFTADADPRGIIAALRQAFTAPVLVRLDADAVPLAEVCAAAGTLSAEDLRLPTGARLGPVDSTAATLSRTKLRLYAVLDLYCLALIEAAAPERSSLAQRLLEHLHGLSEQPVAVDGVARTLGVPRSTLQRTCQAAFACGLSHLHERLRITRAAKLLLGGVEPVAICAERCGYSDVYQFSRAFRRVMGMPPTVYRRRHRELTA